MKIIKLESKQKKILPSHLRKSAFLITIFYLNSAFGNEIINPPQNPNEGERLSEWIIRNDIAEKKYPPGLMWTSLSEINSQHLLKSTLLQSLSKDKASRLIVNWIEERPVTGRIVVGSTDPLWLVANPSQDPVLSAADRLIVPNRPKNISVLLASGQVCQAQYQVAALASEYLHACSIAEDIGDYAWVVQPNGQTYKMGISSWNSGTQFLPQPGAWIWSPATSSKISHETSELLAKFLGTQGVAPEIDSPRYIKDKSFHAWTTAGLSPNRQLESSVKLTGGIPISANSWGETGLLQTPSARMDESGTIRASINRSSPYTRMSVYLQPLDWLETGFRYTDIADRQYDPSGAIASQSYKDKSLDVKIRLWPESRYIPQLALGIRDLGGTGLFAGEYIVANKRIYNFDWSWGLGWGYLGTRGDFPNPIGFAVPQMNQRGRIAIGQGGETNFQNMFRGPVSFFGGIQWQTPWNDLSLKLEIEGNNYKKEPSGKGYLTQSLPINFGASYRISPNTEFNIGLERGNTVTAGITFRSSLANTGSPKPFDPAAPSIAPDILYSKNQKSILYSESKKPLENFKRENYENIINETYNVTDWSIQKIFIIDDVMTVHLDDNGTTYMQDRIQKLLSILHASSPDEVKYWKIIFTKKGLGISKRDFSREKWVKGQLQALNPSQRQEHIQESLPKSIHPDEITIPKKIEQAFIKPQKLNFNLSPSFWQSFGGPDAFMLYQLGVRADSSYQISDNTWISGNANLRLIDNYKKFTYTAPSELPRVRTHVKDYVTRSPFMLSNLQLTHTRQLTENQFYSVYGGLLETMFAGYGAEWLYRPMASRFAFGLDVNQVRQRDFYPNFSLQNYKVSTGHATIYWDTRWQGIRAQLSIGQYLAGDKGATLDIQRTFDNGVVIGGWATKTNISAKQFGEGSFDKGIYVQFPFDIFLPRSSSSKGTFVWQPLLRDGGARLGRTVQLHALTDGRDAMAWRFQPTPSLPNQLITGSDIFKP